jgi:formate hydrogenlyase subunit 3/multisubunit Na+/H+ antiporter MnhD subunit
LFVFALIGFGAKAGFVPWHVWLPEAHPAAPSHVSAIMSGVMIKMGLYGILRITTFLGEPAAWWGPTLIVIGLAGGLVGISLALSPPNAI